MLLLNPSAHSTKQESISDHEYQFLNLATNMPVPMNFQCDIVDMFHDNHTI